MFLFPLFVPLFVFSILENNREALDNSSAGKVDYYCGYGYRRSAAHAYGSIKKFYDACMADKKLLDAFLKDTEDAAT